MFTDKSPFTHQFIKVQLFSRNASIILYITKKSLSLCQNAIYQNELPKIVEEIGAIQ